MPQGLQVWDANGNLTFDTNYGVSRIIGSMFISGSAGSSPIPFLGTGSNLLAFWASNNFGNMGDGGWPQLYITGNNTLNWSGLFISSDQFPREVIIGEATR